MNALSDQPRIAREAGAALGLAIALAWGIGQALFPRGSLELDMVIMFANGWIAGFYCLVISICVPHSAFHIAGAIATLLGLTHLVWCLAGAALLVWAFRGMASSSGAMEDAAMFAVTGAGFMIPIAIASRSWRLVGAMSALTLLSTAFAFSGSTTLGRQFHGVGLPAAPLHIGIGACLYTAARKRLREPDAGPRCAACGYSLDGLPVAWRCPECGATQRSTERCA